MNPEMTRRLAILSNMDWEQRVAFVARYIHQRALDSRVNKYKKRARPMEHGPARWYR